MENEKGKWVNWKKKLIDKLKEDGAKILSIIKKKDNKEYDLNNLKKLSREDKCKFICKCGTQVKIAVRQIIIKSGLCIECQRKKNGEIIWNEKTLWNYFCNKTMLWNIVQSNTKYKWEVPVGKWWRKYHSNFMNAMTYKKIYFHKYENCLTGRYSKRPRNSSENDVFSEILKVYNDEGVGELIKHNLNEKNHLYNYCKNKNFIVKEKDRRVNVPSLNICKKLLYFFPEKCKNILSERNEYLKNKFPQETETFQELYELHIKPILSNLLQNNGLDGFLLTAKSFQDNGYCNIVTTWSKFGKGIYDIRKICGTKLCCDIHYLNLYEFTHRSKFEMRIYNFLYKCSAEVKSPDNPYPQDFKDTYQKNFKDDGKFYSPNEQRWITIEAWGDNNNSGDKRTNSAVYKEHKEIKQKYWKKYPGQCLEIEYEDDKQKLEDILLIKFKPHFGEKLKNGKFGDIKLKILSPDELVNCLDYNEEQNILEYLEEKIYIDKDGKTIVPLLNDIPPHMKSVIGKHGGMENWYKKLDTKRSPNQVQVSKIYKKQQYNISGKKSRKTWKNKSKEEKKSYSNKISKHRKDSGCAKGKNNPMWGKKGENNPNFGKEYHRIDYKKKFIPLFVKWLQQLKCRYINGYLWGKYAKTKKITQNFWSFYSKLRHHDDNPWKESGFKGILQDAYYYAKREGITIRIDFMIVDKIPNAISCEKNRKEYMNFVREHHRKPVEMRDEEKLAVWFRDYNKYISDDNYQPYWDETKKLMDKMFQEEEENMTNLIFQDLKKQIKPLYKCINKNDKKIVTQIQVGWQLKFKNKHIQDNNRFSISKNATIKNRCDTLDECKILLESWIDSYRNNKFKKEYEEKIITNVKKNKNTYCAICNVSLNRLAAYRRHCKSLTHTQNLSRKNPQ